MLFCHFAKQFCSVLSKTVAFSPIYSLNLVIFSPIMFANLWHCIQKLPSESCLLIIFIMLLQPCVSRYDTRGIKHDYFDSEVPDDDHYLCELALDILLMIRFYFACVDLRK